MVMIRIRNVIQGSCHFITPELWPHLDSFYTSKLMCWYTYELVYVWIHHTHTHTCTHAYMHTHKNIRTHTFRGMNIKESSCGNCCSSISCGVLDTALSSVSIVKRQTQKAHIPPWVCWTTSYALLMSVWCPSQQPPLLHPLLTSGQWPT